MKTLTVINTHSFIDLITNSSSELFVCDTKKSIAAVKEILIKLLETHSELSGTKYSYDNVFGEITISKHKFDFYSFPHKLQEEYINYNEYGAFSNSYNRPTEYLEFQKKEIELGKTHPYYIALRAAQKIDSKNYKVGDETLWSDYCKRRDEIWTEYGIKHMESTAALFIQFLKDNEIYDKHDLNVKAGILNSINTHRKNKSGRYSSLNFKNEKLWKIYCEFQENLSYEIKVNKGSIIIPSKSDNTIPYELFDLIDSYLNSQHYHLG